MPRHAFARLSPLTYRLAARLSRPASLTWWHSLVCGRRARRGHRWLEHSPEGGWQSDAILA